MSRVFKLREWAAENDARIVFRLKYSFDMAVGKLIQALDKEGNIVEWSRAFGTKRPDQVVESVPVESVVVQYKGTGEEVVLKSLEELEEYCGLR